MLKEERQQHIIQALHTEGKVHATELSTALNVSEDTIRRDLHELAEAGKLLRVHGGALPRTPTVAQYAVRQKLGSEAKAEVAHTAAQLIQDGQVIILDNGTTTVQVARSLPRSLKATIITNSPPVAMALAEHPGIDVIMVGGNLNKESLAITGAATVEFLQNVRADLCILGVCSLHPEVGISLLDCEEIYVKRAMINSSAEVAAVASLDKLGTAAPYVVGPLTMLTHLVTESTATDDILAPYRALGLTIVMGSEPKINGDKKAGN